MRAGLAFSLGFFATVFFGCERGAGQPAAEQQGGQPNFDEVHFLTFRWVDYGTSPAGRSQARARIALFYGRGWGRDLAGFRDPEPFEDALRGFTFGVAGGEHDPLEGFVGYKVKDVKLVLRLLQRGA